jgi:hypothetical protein
MAALLLVGHIVLVFAANDPYPYVGSVAHTFQATNNGGAQIDIPLPVSPASGGLVPKLSLSFNSQVKNSK